MQSLQTISRSRKNHVLHSMLLVALIASTAVLMPSHALAVIYQVDRSLGTEATLVGTVDIPSGNYTIVNAGPSPFTSVDLTLTVNGTPYTVDNVLTGLINDYVVNGVVFSPEFIINATPTSLIFSTANVGSGSADLVFSDNPSSPVVTDRYALGTDTGGQFEAVATGAGSFGEGEVLFPLQFGTAVPEPSTLGLLAIPFAFQGLRILRARRQIS